MERETDALTLCRCSGTRVGVSQRHRRCACCCVWLGGIINRMTEERDAGSVWRRRTVFLCSAFGRPLVPCLLAVSENNEIHVRGKNCFEGLNRKLQNGRCNVPTDPGSLMFHHYSELGVGPREEPHCFFSSHL